MDRIVFLSGCESVETSDASLDERMAARIDVKHVAEVHNRDVRQALGSDRSKFHKLSKFASPLLEFGTICTEIGREEEVAGKSALLELNFSPEENLWPQHGTR
jgi:hypothetical protein